MAPRSAARAESLLISREFRHREGSLPPRHFGFRTSGAPSRWGGGGSSERLQYMESPFTELVNVLSWIHDGRLFIVSE